MCWPPCSAGRRSIDAHTLLLWGLGANFLISVVVVLVFPTRMAADLRARERELARLRERFHPQ